MFLTLFINMICVLLHTPYLLAPPNALLYFLYCMELYPLFLLYGMCCLCTFVFSLLVH